MATQYTPLKVDDTGSTLQVNSGREPLLVTGVINSITGTPSAHALSAYGHVHQPLAHPHELTQALWRMEILDNHIRSLERINNSSRDHGPSPDWPRWKWELWQLKMYFLIAGESIGLAFKWLGGDRRDHRHRGARVRKTA